jgi:hypothetical protein
MPDILWLLVAYIVGTGFGWYISKASAVTQALEMMLDKLVKEGYVKTRGQGEKTEILKYWEE